MPCLTTSRRAWYELLIEKKEAQLLKAWATLSELLDHEEKEYKFDSKEGYQSLKNVDILELQELIEKLEAQLANLYKKYNCKGIITLNLRRKYYGLQWRGYSANSR